MTHRSFAKVSVALLVACAAVCLGLAPVGSWYSQYVAAESHESAPDSSLAGMPVAWADEASSASSGDNDGSSNSGGSGSDSAALASAVNSDGVVTTESAEALAEAAEQATGAPADDGDKPAQVKIADDGHQGATSVDSDDKNVVDPAQAADNSFIYDTSIASLGDESAVYDGQTVQVAGEVVGDKLASGVDGYWWITVEAEASNDSSSISTYVSDQLASTIDAYGRYGVTGSRVQVRGEYHQACKDHEGLADIHATMLEVTNAGYEHPDSFMADQFVPGILLMIVGLIMVLVFGFVRERMR